MFLKKFGDLAAGVFFLILSIALFLAASALPRSLMGGLGSDFMPKVLAIITFIRVHNEFFCILSFFQIRAGFRTMRSFQPNEGAEEEKPEYLRVLATIAAFTVYVFVIEPAGFLLSSIVYLFAQITILAPKEKRGIKGIILFAVIAVVVCVAVYFIFRFGLNVMLPAGILG